MAKSKPAATSEAFTEFGAQGLRAYSGYVREEWLRDLIGRRGMLKLREMRDNDPIISAVFFAIEMLLRGVPFRVEPASNAPEDQEAADFVQSCFGDMEHSFADLMADILSFLQFGFGVYEIVYKYRRSPTETDLRYKSKYTDGMIGWRKFAGRAQETLLHWVFNEAGDAIAMIQLLPTGGPLLTVPLEKCLHFRTTPYKANPEGRPMMRSAYNYYFLKRNIQQIEAIGVSRDLAGLLCVSVPARWTKKDATPDDQAALLSAKNMATMIANNEQSSLVIPTILDDGGKELFSVKLLATGGRRQFATTEIINRYDHGITASVLADFITLGTGSSRGMGGHGAQSQNKSDMFSTAVVSFLDIIAQQFERKAVPDLLQLNNMKGQVRVTHGDIARRDLQELGTYILDLAQAGLLVPDKSLEAHVREEGGLPAADDVAGDTTGDVGDTVSGEGEKDPSDTGQTGDQRGARAAGATGATSAAPDQSGGVDPNNPNKNPPSGGQNSPGWNSGTNLPSLYGSKNPLVQRAAAMAVQGTGKEPTARNSQVTKRRRRSPPLS